MKQKNQLSVVFIGAGNIASQHMRVLTRFPDVKIDAACDINEKTLRARQSEFGVRTFDSIEKMFQSISPDAAFICLPPYAHGEAELACIEHGIPFLVEKPLSTDLDVANNIADYVRRTGIISCAAYMNRYRKGVQLVKKLFEQHPPSLINGGWLIETPANHLWLTQKHLSGGQLIEQTTHIFDLIRYLCGEVASVYCYGATGFVPKSDVYNTDDATVTSMKMRNGAVVSIQSSWSTGFGGSIYLNFFGPDIRVGFEGWDQNAKIVTAGSSLEITGESNIFEIEDRAFLDAVKLNDRSRILCDYEDGVRSLELSIAANTSLRTGKPVNF